MKGYKYDVEVLELKEVHEIPEAWKNEDFRNLLEFIEFEDGASISDKELKEMTAMALSDLEELDAAEKLLEFRFGDKFSKGQRQNVAKELREDRLWEEYSDISFHEELFNVACMLNWAFPKKFPVPDIVKARLKIKSLNPLSATNLSEPSASFITRLLTDGMDEHNAIFRLFEDNINSNKFSEAKDIIWSFQASVYEENEHAVEVTLFTSWNWIEELKGVKTFESSAFSDGQFE